VFLTGKYFGKCFSCNLKKTSELDHPEVETVPSAHAENMINKINKERRRSMNATPI
jgi:hypothetical protein